MLAVISRMLLGVFGVRRARAALHMGLYTLLNIPLAIVPPLAACP